MAGPTEPSAAGVAKLMGYGYSILSAIQAGGRTADIWQAVRTAGGFAEGEPVGATIFDMNYVTSLWRQVARSSQAIAAAESTQAVTADMWAWAPWTFGGAAANVAPEYQLRYGATFGPEGSAGTIYQSVTIPQSIEGLTVGDLQGIAASSAAAIEAGDAYPGSTREDIVAVVGSGSVAVIPGSISIMRV